MLYLKLVLVVAILVSALCTMDAQNLVPNPSFEDTVYCPYAYDLWALSDWIIFNQSPDYYHSCEIGNLPDSNNYPNAATGLAYSGIFTYSNILSDYREYI